MSPSLAAFAQGFAVDINEEGFATRNVYRTTTMGPYIQVFILDARRGYYGKQQMKWLKDELKKSNYQWKIVLTGPSLGFNKVFEMSSRRGSRPFTNVGSGAVQMQLPEPAELDDVDEHGRPKTSLGYVVDSLQKHAEKVQKDNSGEGDFGEEKHDSNDNTSTVDDEEPEPDDGSVKIESGIVFISGGVCKQPFIATYDPCRWGRPFVAEIGVGAALQGTPTSSDETSRIEQANDLHPSFIFEGPSSLDATEGGTRFSGSVSLREDGTLALRICKEGPNGAIGEVISDVRLKSAKSTNNH
jgi:hypothetical protein